MKDIKSIYEESFVDELEKISFLKFRKRKQPKKETWKEKFASRLKSNIKEYHLDTSFGRGLARFILRK